MTQALFPHQEVGFWEEVSETLGAVSSAVQQAESNRQLSNARAELIRQQGLFDQHIADNPATPGQWLADLDAQKDSIKEQILSHVAHRSVREAVENDFGPQWEAWKKNIRAKGEMQMARNADTDFKLRVSQLTENYAYTSVADLMPRLKAYVADVDRMWNNGRPLVDSLPTEEVYRQMRQDGVEKMVADYLVQHPEELDDPNGFLERNGIDIGHFDPDESAALKKRYQQELDLADAARRDRAAVFSKEISKKIIELKPTDDVSGLLDSILNNPDISAAELRTLTSLYDTKIEGMAKKSPAENDPYALADAYKIMTADLSQQQKFERLMALKPQLKSTTVDGFIADIYKPETVSNEIYKQYSSAITNLKTSKVFSADLTENINLSIKAQQLLRRFAEENPDATEKEYAEFFNKLIENQARWWAILPGGRPWSGRRKQAELRASIPRNIEAIQKENTMKQYKVGDKRTVNGVTYTFDGEYWMD